jgi:oxygen-dependent protoporphyrinogen oxidase
MRVRSGLASAPRRVVVIGGGISGLAAAHRIGELGAAAGATPEVTVLESGERVGGSIGTERIDGFVIERGADSILTEKPWALALCRRLGIEDRLVRTRDEERRTLIVHDGRLEPLPEGFLLMGPTAIWPIVSSPLFTWRGKLRMAADLVLPRGGAAGEESLASFVERRFGREVLDRVVQPLAGGIYTADPERLSLTATMPRFIDMERRYRSVILALRRQHAAAGARTQSGARWSMFVSFADGIQTLTDALAARLAPGSVRLATRATAVSRARGGGWRVTLEGGDAVEADAVIVATPAHAAAALFHDVDPQLARALAAIPYASSAAVTLAYDRADVPHPLDAFGFVVPVIEGRELIACTFSHVKYPGRAPAGSALIRVFSGGALAARMTELDDDALVASARRELGELLGIRAAPTLIRVSRHARAMPQYHLGHLARVAAIEDAVAALSGLALAGNAYRGVGIPDCVHSGEQAAEAVMGVAGTHASAA